MSPEGDGRRGKPAGEIFFELIRQGNFIKATAIDPVSGREASIVGPASAAPADLRTLAMSKLRRLLGNPPDPDGSVEPGPASSPGRGIVI